MVFLPGIVSDLGPVRMTSPLAKASDTRCWLLPRLRCPKDGIRDSSRSYCYLPGNYLVNSPHKTGKYCFYNSVLYRLNKQNTMWYSMSCFSICLYAKLSSPAAGGSFILGVQTCECYQFSWQKDEFPEMSNFPFNTQHFFNCFIGTLWACFY